MDIAIIGGGISGCMAYAMLTKHLPQHPSGKHHQITVYEAYDTSADTTADDRGQGPTHSSTLIVGGGLGVGANGLNVIKRLDEDLLRDITKHGYAIGTMSMKSKNGTVLANMQPAGPPTMDAKGQDSMNMVSCSRHMLWRCMRLRVPDSAIVTKRVSKVVANPDGRNTVSFVDGSPTIEADLVIGADGLKSVAKRALFPDAKEDPYPPQYEGLCGVGGFVPYESVKDHIELGTMSFLLGGNGFFGYFIAESSQEAPHRGSPYHISTPGESVAWWSTYAVEKCPDAKTLDTAAVTAQLKQRHKDWNDPVVQRILATIQVKNMYPTWIVPPLPTWERDAVVLVGDAAHALPSTSGQGSSQALEDVEALSMFLAHRLKNAYSQGDVDKRQLKTVINSAAKQYQALRQPHVAEILKTAQQMQDSKRDKGTASEYAMYAFMWVLGCFPSLLTRSLKQVSEYNVAEEVRKAISREG